MKKITLIGDSIRMGYQPVATELLRDVAVIWGPEQNGGTSANILNNIQAWLLDQPADLIHINCGLHDLKKEYGSDEWAVPLDQYAANVRHILETAQAKPGTRVVWATTTPVIDERHNPIKGFNRFQTDVERYNAAALQVAHELGVAVDDLHAVVVAGGAEELLVHDGVHYTEAGSAVLGEAVAKFIRQELSL